MKPLTESPEASDVAAAGEADKLKVPTASDSENSKSPSEGW